jgi:MYXO-CTERM domain-containing protein
VTSFGTSDDCTGLDASTHVAGELAFIDQYVPGPNNTGGGNNNNGTPGGNTGGTDPDGNPAGGDDGVGEAPSVLGGCSVGQGAGAGGGLAPLVLLGLALLVGRRRA